MSFLAGQGSRMKTWLWDCTPLVPPLVLCADPLVKDTPIGPQGRPSPQVPLAWEPSFCDLLSQAGRASVCLALCPMASHHPELPTSDLRSKFSQLLVQWPSSSSGSHPHQCSALDAFVGIFQTKGRIVSHQTDPHGPPVISSSETSCRLDPQSTGVWPLMGLQGHLRGQPQWLERRAHSTLITLEASGTHTAMADIDRRVSGRGCSQEELATSWCRCKLTGWRVVFVAC